MIFGKIIHQDLHFHFCLFALFRCEEEGHCSCKEERKPGPAAMDQVSEQSLLVVVQLLWWRREGDDKTVWLCISHAKHTIF